MLILVYGTLKRGQCNHDLLAGAQFLGEARTQPHYRLYDLGPFPALVEVNDSEGNAILGEVFDVPDDIIEELDDFEGCPSLYDRAVVELEDFADTVEAYFYQRFIPPDRPYSNQWPMYLA